MAKGVGEIINNAHEFMMQYDKLKASMSKEWNIEWCGKKVTMGRYERFVQCMTNSLKFLSESDQGPKVALADGKVIGVGYYNIVLKFSGKLYRMCYTLVSDNFITQAIESYKLLMTNPNPTYYGVLRPRCMWVSSPKDGYERAFMIYELLEAEPLNGFTYDEFKDMCKRLLQLANGGLCNADVHWDNLMRYKGKLVNIDLDLLNDKSIKRIVKKFEKFSGKSPEELKELLRAYVNKNKHDLVDQSASDAGALLASLCFNRNEANVKNWMLWSFNTYLYKMRWNIPMDSVVIPQRAVDDICKDPLHFGGL